MEEQQIDPSKVAPDVSLTGGLIDPGSLREVKLDLPDPPRPYPSGVRSSSFLPNQRNMTPSSTTIDQVNDYAEGLKQKLANPQAFAKNPYHYGKVSAYNADYDGANFARYARVSDTFKKHGFSPYRNNEAIYDKESTWWDYYKRSAGAAFDLAKSSFQETLPWNAWDGKSSDIEAAIDMQRAHAIGHDNRGGFGSFVNNMTTDFGYTAGILGEFAAEEAALFVGSKAMKQGPGSVFAFSEMATGTLQNIQKAYRGFTKADKIKDAYKYLSSTATWLKGGMKLSNFYDYAKSGAKFLIKEATPETAHWLSDMYKSGVGVRQGQLMVDMAKASKGFGAFYRDARLYSGVVSESKVEGGSTELDVRDKLIDKYIATHGGRQPDETALQEIYRQAADAGRQTYLFNVPALFLSNKIVFDKALKGFGPLSAFREELKRGVAGKLTYNEAWKKAGGKAWSAVETSFMDTVKALGKKTTYAPRNLFKNVVGSFANYTKANLTEGLQEMYQDAVSNTMKDYYVSNMYNDKVVGSRSFLGAFADNIGKSVTSTEGWSTFGSGFLMGSMAYIPQKVAFDIAPKKFSQIFDSENFKKARDEERKRTDRIVDALNAATMNDNFWDAITENAGVQVNGALEADKAAQADSKKAFYDITDQMVYKHIHTLMSTGKISLLKDTIEDFKRLDEKALQEAFGPVPPSEKAETYYKEKLDSMSRKIKLIEDNYEDIESRHGNPFNPGFYDPEKDPVSHAYEIAAYNSWEKAKEAAVYSKYSYQRSVDRMKSISENFAKNNPYGDTAQSEATMLLDSDKVGKEIQLLEDEIKTYKQGDEKAKKLAEEKEAYLEFIKDYKTSLDAFLAAKQVQSYKDAGVKKSETDEAERQVTIQKGTVVKNKKGNTNTVDSVKKGFAYNAKGEKIGKLKDLEVVSTEVSPEDISVVGHAAELLRESYTKLVKARAKQLNKIVSDESIEKTFDEIVDYLSLSHDAKDMAEAANILHNPQGLLAYAKRYAILEEESKKQHKENLRKAYQKFHDSLTVNDLFVELYKIGVFLDEKGMDAVIEKRVPSDFYDINKKERIPENSTKYREIMDLIEKYEKARDMEFEDKPIEEADDTMSLFFSTARRNKIQQDTRTFKQIAEQYGFDPDPNATSKVKTKEILKKIIDSKYATYREQALARRLLNIVKDESEITFTKLANPGEFRHSDETKVGTFIDARYMSRDYRGGKMTPLEYVILHELIHELTVMEMSKDAEFKKEITRLLETAKKEFETNPPTDQTLYQTGTEKPFYGLMNEAEFLSELFTNDRFAMWLNTIKGKETGKTTWDEFKDALRKFLKRLLGVSEDSTLLDEALYIATTFIDKTQLGIQPQQQKAAATPSGNILNLGSSIDEFQAAGILPNLIQAYKDFVKTQIGPDRVSASEWPDAFALEKTDEEIKNSKYFRDFLNLGLTSASKIIADHNSKVAPKKATRPAPQPQAPAEEVKPAETPKAPSRVGTGPKADLSQKRILGRDLGYTDQNELNAMSKEEAQRLIDGNITKAKRDRELQKQAEEAAAQATRTKEEQMLDLEEKIANATYKTEIEALVNDFIAADPISVDSERVDRAVEARLTQLALDINFDDIKVNEAIKIKNGPIVMVVEKTDDKLVVRKLGDSPDISNFDIKKSEVKDKVLYKDQPFVETLKKTDPEVQQQTQDTSTENLNKAQELNTTDSVREDMDLVKNMTQEDVNNDFENSLGCKQ